MDNIVAACCRDEADCIEVFIRFYITMGFDWVVIIDNRSTDGTSSIVKNLILNGLPVLLFEDTRLGFERHLTEYYQMIGSTFDVRWLFFLDCDEFILFPDGAISYLDALPQDVNCLRLAEREMYPIVESPGDFGSFLLTRRASPRFSDTTKEVSVFNPEAKVYAGKHEIWLPSKKVLHPSDVFIRHYRFRSPEQAARKMRNKVEAHSAYSDSDIERDFSFNSNVVRKWFTECKNSLNTESWVSHFDGSINTLEDPALALWATCFLRSIQNTKQ